MRSREVLTDRGLDLYQFKARHCAVFKVFKLFPGANCVVEPL